MGNALVSSLQGLHSGQSKQLEDNVRTGIREQLFLPSDTELRKHLMLLQREQVYLW